MNPFNMDLGIMVDAGIIAAIVCGLQAAKTICEQLKVQIDPGAWKVIALLCGIPGAIISYGMIDWKDFNVYTFIIRIFQYGGAASIAYQNAKLIFTPKKDG